MVARLLAQARPRPVALVQGEADQVVGESVVGVGLGEAGANDKVLGSAAALAAGAAALHGPMLEGFMGSFHIVPKEMAAWCLT